MSFTYITTTPGANQQLSVSQGEMLTNFQSINSWTAVDHAGFANANAGKHIKVSFPTQNPAPTFSALETGMYSFIGTATPVPEIYVNRFLQNGTAFPIPMTASVLSEQPALTNNMTGWTYLPSGILLKWGEVTVDSASGGPEKNVSLTGNGPGFIRTFSVQATIVATSASDPNTAVSIRNITPTQFGAIVSVRNANASYTQANIQYLAIGY